MKKIELKRLIVECIDELIDLEFPLTKAGELAYQKADTSPRSSIVFNYIPIIQENLGALSNESIKTVADNIYDKFLHLIESSKDLKDLLSKHDSFHFDSSHYKIKVKPIQFKIELKFIEINQHNNSPYMSARLVEQNPNKDLEIYIKDSSTLSDLLKYKQHLFKLVLHECKHVFDIVTKGSLINLNPYSDLVKYLNHSQEYHAYLSNIILEMKEYLEQHPSCSYNETLNASNTWNLYFNNKDTKNEIHQRIKRYFLEKTAYWWIHKNDKK